MGIRYAATITLRDDPTGRVLLQLPPGVRNDEKIQQNKQIKHPENRENCLFESGAKRRGGKIMSLADVDTGGHAFVLRAHVSVSSTIEFR